jgi:Mechanosensitive ion channel, conserved TM helix
MSEMIWNGFHEAFQNLTQMLAEFLPRLIVMVAIILLGWIIAVVLRSIVRLVLRGLQLDRLSEQSGASHLLQKATLPSLSELVSRSVFWLSWLGFMVLGVSVLGISSLQNQMSRFFLFLPQVFVALLILLAGMLAANFFSRAALLAAVNAGYPSPRMLSGTIRLIIVAMAISMALEQVGLGTHTVLMAFSIVFGALMLGLAIAFGFGGQDLAKGVLEKYFRENHKNNGDEPSPL